MDLEIIGFEKEDRGFRVGVCDIKITYSEDKWEIFRNIGIFNKEGRKWTSLPKIKRDIPIMDLDEKNGYKQEWLPTYERNPAINQELYPKLLKMLERDYL